MKRVHEKKLQDDRGKEREQCLFSLEAFETGHGLLCGLVQVSGGRQLDTRRLQNGVAFLDVRA
jgi:hypothetical protein